MGILIVTQVLSDSWFVQKISFVYSSVYVACELLIFNIIVGRKEEICSISHERIVISENFLGIKFI